MDISIRDYETEEVWVEITEASSAQVVAYSSADVINLRGKELVVEVKVMDYENNVLNILVADEEDEIELDDEPDNEQQDNDEDMPFLMPDEISRR
jgi:hypothetical protein